MNKVIFCSFLTVIALVIASTVSGQAPANVSGNDSLSDYKDKLTVLPVIGSSPETSLMLGGVAIQQFKPSGSGAETRPSNIIVSAIYTLNNQMIFELSPALILPQESWILAGYYSAYYFPDQFWGVGPNTSNDDQITIKYKMFQIRQMALKQVAPSVYTGPYIRWYKNDDFSFIDGNDIEFEPSGLKGSEGGSAFGIGGIFRWDERNSFMTPTENHFIELSAVFYPGLFGTSFQYSQFRIDARKYVDLRGDAKSVLAFHSWFQATKGNVPFMELANLGGNDILRGYYMGRFRDRYSLQLQAEWRRHIRGRFGFALFGGAGDVWPAMDQFKADDIKVAGGAGLRFNLNPGDTTHLRIDYAIGKNTSGLYLTIGEAF